MLKSKQSAFYKNFFQSSREVLLVFEALQKILRKCFLKHNLVPFDNISETLEIFLKVIERKIHWNIIKIFFCVGSQYFPFNRYNFEKCSHLLKI